MQLWLSISVPNGVLGKQCTSSHAFVTDTDVKIVLLV